MTDRHTVAHFYTAADGEHDRSLFEVWEDGEARGDSITPSTYSAEYRDWMYDLLVAELTPDTRRRMVSLGCGNARVEQRIVRAGYPVLAVDLLPEAVELALRKGVPAEQGDVTTWMPAQRPDLVYLDGLLGHLYDSAGHGLPVLGRVRSWLGAGGVAVISNDATADQRDSQAAPGVPDFHWLSVAFIERELKQAGFDEVVGTTFVYQRPRSGPRTRSVIVGRVCA
jgi:SAM-dependent methyltransferase